ncbi:hypothetical protein F4818DRAFT_238028 [Hypoxylon cercidicola]|nr:hypothetical protein F4818DRAFT_238028 [Hypoxylon cercidicola]
MYTLNLLKFHRSTSTGWKRAAKVNCIVLICMSLALLGCLIAAAIQVGGIQKALFFYEGDCDEGSVSRVNTALHLLINVISTLVTRFKQLLHAGSELSFEGRSE